MELSLEGYNSSFYEFIEKVDEKNVVSCHFNSNVWFNKQFPLKTIEQFYKSPIKINMNGKNPTMMLKIPTYKGKILVGGKNFGSGSSREHAAWSIYDYGFRCVISSFFADIFSANCLNIGVLPVRVSEEFLNVIFENIYNKPNIELLVDLPNQLVSIPELNLSESFNINDYKKNNMLNGYDDIDYLINMKKSITDFANTTPL